MLNQGDQAASALAFRSSAAPASTTAELAKDVPLEEDRLSSSMPGGFPETPAPAEYGSCNPLDQETRSAGIMSETPTAKAHDSADRPSEPTTASKADAEGGSAVPAGAEEQTFSVNPLPATAGTDNPISLRPGEKVPHPSNFTANDLNSAVTLDKASYERRGSLPFLPPVVTPAEERSRKGTGVLDLPPISGSLIPESSLPVGGGDHGNLETDSGVHVSSAAPESSTAALAAQVPLEPRQESAHGAHLSSAAPDSSTAALAAQVPLLPREESARGVHTSSAAPDSSTAALAAQVPLEPRQGSGHGEHLSSAAPDSSTAALASQVPLEPRQESAQVPTVVKESIQEARVDSEPTASPEAVREKHEVETELEKEVKPTPPTSEGVGNESTTKPATGVGSPESNDADMAAPSPKPDSDVAVDTPVAAVGAFGGGGSAAATTKLPDSVTQSIQHINATADQGTATGVPNVVTRSLEQAHESPEAAANTDAVVEKREVERELLGALEPTQAAGEPAPSESPALTAVAPQPTAPAQAATEQKSPGGRQDLATADDARRSIAAPAHSHGSVTTTTASPPVAPVSPEAKVPPPEPQAPAVVTQETNPGPATTTGVDTTTAEPVSTPQKDAHAPTSATSTPQASSTAGETPSSTPSKKEKRKSGFFGKLKEKLKR